MGSGAENIYTLPPPAVPPLGEAAPRTPGAGPGRPRGGGSLSTETPGPGLAPSRQPGGGSPLPPPSRLGQGGGSTRGGAAPKLGGLGGSGGGGPAACPAAHPAPRLGAGAQDPALPHGHRLPRQRDTRSEGGTCAWDTRSREWGDEQGTGEHSEQGKGKKATHPHHPPP